MLAKESALPREQRVDVVSIVTPNDTHAEIARAFIEGGFHVILDKPMVNTPEQARELAAAVTHSGKVLCVTYNYSGYPMVKQARDLVRSGKLGAIRKVIVEYNQGWLATALEQSGQKQAAWRTDPSRSGVGGAIGDIGSHAEQLTSFVTGLELESICADVTTFVPGRKLDDDASVLLRFKGGAKGVLVASQICVGKENDFRLRVWGEKGGLEWRQEEPNHLVYSPAEGPEQVYRRGNSYAAPSAAAVTRLPSGHPEAFIEAFANIYSAAADAIEGKKVAEYPTVHDGARGVNFIHAVVKSGASSEKWTRVQ
jgi:predicted dehydrogenase